MRRHKRVVPGLLLLTALAAMRATVAQSLPEVAGMESVKSRLVQLPVWGIELAIPGYRSWDDYPASNYGPNFLLAALSSGTCELNLSMFAEECKEGATPEQCVRGPRSYAGNPDTVARWKNIRGLEHQSAPLNYTRFDQVLDDPRDPVAGAFIKSHGPVVQNQLYGYWTRGRYCFELHISSIACASFTEQAMSIVRSMTIGPDTGATHETVLMARLTGAPHNSYQVHAAVARNYSDRKAWAAAVPFYRSALALGDASIPDTERIDLQVGLGDALIRPNDSRAEGIGFLEQALQSAQTIGDAERVRTILFPLSWGLALAGDTDNACARVRALLEPLHGKDRKEYVREIRDSWPCHALHRAECYKELLGTMDVTWREGPWKSRS